MAQEPHGVTTQKTPFFNMAGRFIVASSDLFMPSRMPSSGMLRRVDLVRTDVSKECSATIIRVTKIGELETLVVTNNGSTL
jgi:hypothetical protein